MTFYIPSDLILKDPVNQALKLGKNLFVALC
jgi:hypothetical protein